MPGRLIQPGIKKLETVNEDYKNCLDEGKTERECIRLTIERIEKAGYRNIEEWIEKLGRKWKVETRFMQSA